MGTPPFLRGGDGISPKTLKGVGSDISILKGWDAQKGGGSFIKGGDGQFLLHIFENPLSFDRFIKSHSQKHFISI